MKKIIFLVLLPIFIQADFEQIHDDDMQENYTKAPLPAKPTDVSKPADTPQTIVWTKPLIIDSNNRDFDGVTTFTFPCNIVYKPDPNYITPWIYTNYSGAFIINKDNITIDFNGYNLSFQAPATSNFMINNPTYGIAIYQGVKNLKIISSTQNGSNQPTHKGSITNFTGYAIFGSGSTQSYNSYDIYSLRIKNLTIDNLFITSNKNGIFLENAFNPTITNTNVIYNYSPQITYGIYFSNILDGLIDSCNVNQNWSYNDMYGMYLQDTANVTVQNCQANSNQSLKNGNATGYHIAASTLSSGASSSNLISNCNANRNLCSYLTDKTSIGFRITNNSVNNSIENCTSLRGGHTETFAGALPPVTPPTAVGFQLDSTNFNIMTGNTSGYHSDAGFVDTSAISTSFYTRNVSMFNVIANYSVTVPNPNPSDPPGPLDTTKLFANDLTAFTGSGPQLVNLDIQSQG